MDVYMVILRVVHIFAGVLWAGWAFAMVGFIEPASKAAGPEGPRFMQTLTGKTKLLQTMLVAPLLVIFTGLLMYWPASGGLSGRWLVSGAGLAVTIKSLAGILAFVSGLVISRPAAERLAALSKEVQSAGKPPSPQQLGQLRVQGEQLSRGGLYSAILLGITVVGASVARFL
jgi:small-conductance mechanosensitive channel